MDCAVARLRRGKADLDSRSPSSPFLSLPPAIIGTKDCKAEQLNNFLKHHTCDTLYLVGDIIDAWKIQQNKWRWKQSHTNVVRRILGHAKRGTKVIFIAGNHDEFLRPMIPYGFSFGSIEIHNQIEHIGADGKHYTFNSAAKWAWDNEDPGEAPKTFEVNTANPDHELRDVRAVDWTDPHHARQFYRYHPDFRG